MKILITADIHNGYPGRIDDTVWAMNAISEYGVKSGAEKVVVLGDLFHNRSYITTDVLNKVFQFFDSVPDGQEWIAFPGNHDMFMKTSWDINSIKPFSRMMTVIEGIDTIVLGSRRFHVVPFMHYESEYLKAISELDVSQGDVLLTHIGVNNATSNSCFLMKHWNSINFSDSGLSLVLAGHFHNYQVIDDMVCYPGSPIPFKFDEGMVPHGFLEMDTESFEINFVDLREIRDDCPKDFVTISDESFESMSDADKKELFDKNDIRLRLEREYSKSELESIRSNMEEMGAQSISWMKAAAAHESEEVPEVKDVDLDRPPFQAWVESRDISKYDKDLLMKLHADVRGEAESLYVESEETADA